MHNRTVLTHVEFRSGRFSAQVAPSLRGRQLAEFLRDGLRNEGFDTKEPIEEDWGWMLPVVNEQFRLWIGCGHYEEYPDGFLCFIEPHTPFVRRLLKKIDTRERVASLQQAMDNVLSEAEGIRDKRWWTHDEFNDPSSVKSGSKPMSSTEF